MNRALLVMVAGAVCAIAIGWLIASRVPEWFGSPPPETAALETPTATPEGRRIRVTLFFVSQDGTRLVAVPQEVPFAESSVDQAQRLLEAQLGPAPAPYAAPLPAGTTVRAVFLTERHDAFVDLSPEVTTAHSGGSIDELLSVYAIVNALTVNLPAIERVQILVGGKEVESLAGHVDLRRPLPRNMSWVAGRESPTTDPSLSPGAEPTAPAEPQPPPPGPAPAPRVELEGLATSKESAVLV